MVSFGFNYQIYLVSLLWNKLKGKEAYMKFKILVVEDEESINDILSAALKSDGYQ